MGPLLSLGCSRDAPHAGEWRLLLQARKGGLDAAWRCLPIGPGTRRSGVKACKVSLKEEKRAPSGEPELLGSGEAAEPPVGGHGVSARFPGFLFSLKSRRWRRSQRYWSLLRFARFLAVRTVLASPTGWKRDPGVSGMVLRAPWLAPGLLWPEAGGR